MTAKISIPLAAVHARLPADVVSAEALRRHQEIPVYVQPDPSGWRAVRLQADPRPRVPVFEEADPSDVYDIVLTEPVLLTPDVLREVLATGKLDRVTVDGETIGTVREEVGYTAWSIDVDGTADFDGESAGRRRYKEMYRLCEAPTITLGSLLVPRSAVDLLAPLGESSPTSVAPPTQADLVGAMRMALTSTPVHVLLGVSRRDAERITLLGRDALLSLDRLAGLVPRSDKAVKDAVRQVVKIRRIAGKEMVTYGEFLEAFPPQDAVAQPRPTKAASPSRSKTSPSKPTAGRVTKISPSDW
jgi:hypothetical protein